MTGLTDTLAKLAASTDERVQALHARYVAGELTAEEFIAYTEAVLAVGTDRAAALADTAAALAVTGLAAKVALPLGLTASAPTAAALDLADSTYRPLGELLGSTNDLGVEVRDRIKVTGQNVYKQSLARHGVKKWRRQTDGGACELCRDLAADTLPMTAKMYRHRGCGCIPKPVAEKEN